MIKTALMLSVIESFFMYAAAPEGTQLLAVRTFSSYFVIYLLPLPIAARTCAPLCGRFTWLFVLQSSYSLDLLDVRFASGALSMWRPFLIHAVNVLGPKMRRKQLFFLPKMFYSVATSIDDMVIFKIRFDIIELNS